MKLTARVEPTELRLGEAATLTVTLAGRGNVQGVGEPRVPPPPGFKIFPPQQQGEENVVGTSVQGTRIWSWLIVPERTGRAALRLPEIPYFDPQSGTYKVASAPPVEITTLPPANAAGKTADTGDTEILRSIRNAAAGPDRAAFSWPRMAPWLIALPLSTRAALRRGPPAAISSREHGKRRRLSCQRSAGPGHGRAAAPRRRRREPAAAGRGAHRGGLARLPRRALGDPGGHAGARAGAPCCATVERIRRRLDDLVRLAEIFTTCATRPSSPPTEA